jgi:hypothetical protein
MQLLKQLLEITSEQDTPDQYVDMPQTGVKKRGKGKRAHWAGITKGEKTLVDTIWDMSNRDAV